MNGHTDWSLGFGNHLPAENSVAHLDNRSGRGANMLSHR